MENHRSLHLASYSLFINKSANCSVEAIRTQRLHLSSLLGIEGLKTQRYGNGFSGEERGNAGEGGEGT